MNSQQSKRQVSSWLALGALAVCLLLAAAALWWYFSGGGDSGVIITDVPAEAPAPNRPAGNWWALNADGVTVMGDKTIRARVGGIVLIANPSSNPPRWQLNYTRALLDQPRLRETMRTAQRALAVAPGNPVELSPPQRQQLQAALRGSATDLSAAEINILQKCVVAYTSADPANRAAQTQNLLAEVKRIGEEQLPQRREQMALQVAAIREIFTPEQWRLLSAPRGGATTGPVNAATAATAPGPAALAATSAPSTTRPLP